MKKAELLSLLSDAGIFPSRNRGQNFLWNEQILKRISQSVPKVKIAIEIGTGPGSLTEELCGRFERVVSYEVDHGLYRLSSKRLSSFENLEIRHCDFMDSDPHEFPESVFCGNLPYSIANRIIVWLVSTGKPMVFMIQKEAADRLCAPVNTKDFSFFSSFTRYYYDVSNLFQVSRDSFHPQPRVDSVVIKLEPLHRDFSFAKDLQFFVKKAFSCRRKKMVNNFKGEERKQLEQVLCELEIRPDVRAQMLSPEQMANVFSHTIRSEM